MDLQAIKQAAATYGPAMTKFLREIVAFPGESAEEKDHVKRIEQEMKDLGFDRCCSSCSMPLRTTEGRLRWPTSASS